MPPPGRVPTQTLERPAGSEVTSSIDMAPRSAVAVGGPPTLDTVQGLTMGGNAAVGRALSGGGPGPQSVDPMQSIDPMQSTMDGEEALDAGVPADGVTDVATTDAPPDSGSSGGGSDGGGGQDVYGPSLDGGYSIDEGPRDGGQLPDGQIPDGQIPGQVPGGDTAAGPQLSAAGPTTGPTSGPVSGPNQLDAGPVPMSLPGMDGAPVNAGASGLPEQAPVVGPAGIDPVLVDDELAEHERWGSAAAAVGEAGSAERAGYVAEQVGAGLGTGALTGAAAGIVLSLGTRAATRLAARRIPVPVVGAVIGGAIGAMALYGQIFEKPDEILNKLGAFGEGASGYEVAANTIDAIVTGLDVAGNVLDTIGLVAGLVAAVAWALAIPTFGASTAVAAPATSIATGASAASAVLGLVKMALQPQVMLFRALHTFTSQADPRGVQAAGAQLQSDAGAVGGVLGGFAGSAVGNRASDKLGLPADPTRATRVEETAGAGGARSSSHPEGPSVEAVPSERLIQTAEEIRVAEALRNNPNGTVLGADGEIAAGGPLPGGTVVSTPPTILGADGRPARPAPTTGTVLGADGAVANRSVIVDPSIEGVEYIPASGGGRAAQPEPDIARQLVPTIRDNPADPNSERVRSLLDADPTYAEVRAALVRMDDQNVSRSPIIDPNRPQGLAPLGYGHGHLVDADGNEIPSRFGPFRGEIGQPTVDPTTGQRIWDPETRLNIPGTGENAPEAAFAVRAGPPGSWADGVWDQGSAEQAQRAAMEHALARAVAGDREIADTSALPRGWAGNAPGVVPSETYPINEMNVYGIDPSTPRLESVVAPQPEGLPGSGRPRIYSGGGPQVQLPFGTIPRDADPVASFKVYKQGLADDILDGPVGDIDNAGDAAALAGVAAGVMDTGGNPARDAAPGATIGAPAAGEIPTTERRVEPVNPAYERPPGTTEELAQMRSEIASMLVSRSQADADADAARADRAETDRRAEQLVSVAGGVDTLGRRVDTQATDVADTTQVNRQQQGRQEQAGTALGASASRLAGLATLELMLGGWAAVAGGIGTAISFVSDSGAAKMNQLSDDARRFMAQLARAKMLVSEQGNQHPMQMGRLGGDASALGAEANRTASTDAGIDRSRQQVTALGAQNTADSAAAQAAEQRARGDASEAQTAADEAQARHDQLAADLEAWAQRHREQRQLAIAQTVDRLEAEGYDVTNAPTW